MSDKNQKQDQAKPDKNQPVETATPPNRLHQGSLNPENVEKKDISKEK